MINSSDNLPENSTAAFKVNTKGQGKVYYVDWPVNNVLALTTTRHNPFNKDKIKNIPFTSPFQNFNLGLHVGDDEQTVLNNRKDLHKLLPIANQIQWLEQIHGADVVTVTEHTGTPIIADAAITQTKGITLAIMTADCLPIVLASKNGDEIAAIHGGWRPLAANIITNTLKKMQTRTTDIVAWLGPCIGNKAFEVGAEVKQAFIEHSPVFSQAFTPIPINNSSIIVKSSIETTKLIDEKYFADLSLIACIQLQRLGINAVYSLGHCTFQAEDNYYSYRRDGQTGRMATLICRT